MAKQEIGKNVTVEVTGTKMVIEIDLSKDHGLSKSQKSKVVATTAGSASIPGKPGLVLNLNLNEKV